MLQNLPDFGMIIRLHIVSKRTQARVYTLHIGFVLHGRGQPVDATGNESIHLDDPNVADRVHDHPESSAERSKHLPHDPHTVTAVESPERSRLFQELVVLELA